MSETVMLLTLYACLFMLFILSIFIQPAFILHFILRNPCNRQYAGFLRHVQSPLLSAALHRQVRMEFLSFPLKYTQCMIWQDFKNVLPSLTSRQNLLTFLNLHHPL